MRQFNTSRFGSPNPFKGQSGLVTPWGTQDCLTDLRNGSKFGFGPKPPLPIMATRPKPSQSGMPTRPTSDFVDAVLGERANLTDRLTSFLLNDLAAIETDVLDEVDMDDHDTLDSYSRELIKVAVHETLLTIEDRCEIRAHSTATMGQRVSVQLFKLGHQYWEHVNS